MKFPLTAIGLASLLCAGTVLSRPLLPPDETRYVTVAWESLQRGDFLVSHLNGETYAHKPPLLFWLINLAWVLCGESDTVARSVAPLAAVFSVFLTWRLGLRLWPQAFERAGMAALIHTSSLLWMYFSPVTMFDALLTVFVQGALLGVLRAAGGDSRGFWQAGLCMGLGILSKGPVLLVFVLPVMLAGSLNKSVNRSRHWLFGVFCSVLLAAVTALAWVIPSALSGGRAYADELLFGQTAGRMVNSFAHRQPFWFYAAVLPPGLLPWLLLGSVWRGLRGSLSDGGVRFAAVWLGAAFVILSAVSGKQPYYILPAIPAAALLLAAAADRGSQQLRGFELLPVFGGTVLLGAVPLVVNAMKVFSGTGLQGLVNWRESLVLMATAPGLLLFRRCRTVVVVTAVAVSAVLFQVILVNALTDTLWNGFDLRPMAEFVRNSNRPVGWFGGYHGQLNYLGGLQFVAELRGEPDVSEWLSEQPGGILIVRLARPESEVEASLYVRLRRHDREVVAEAERGMLAEELRSALELPCESKLSGVLYVQWVRSGLREQPYVIAEFRE
ncbi:MAG: Undecaprenyl phosphate-alpha-4-amino-4-deoxy-L-arabinose arabinosyl transferase [Planctomycetota bacterium]|jgi:4-amino-4-deoxy-L-arabinose transferase-like glycosyltransferase